MSRLMFNAVAAQAAQSGSGGLLWGAICTNRVPAVYRVTKTRWHMPRLSFDALAHSYTLDGQPVPNVTRILSTAGLVDLSRVPPQVLERKRQLGRAIHRACELHDLDLLDDASVSPEVRPYLDAWVEWKAMTHYEPLLSEYRVYSERYGYAGTFDRLGLIQGRQVLIDIKSSAVVGPAVGPQTAGYLRAAREMGIVGRAESVDRYAVLLNGKGTARMHKLDDEADERVFLAALQLSMWKKKHSGGESC
jgi:hypothetical protein